MAEVSQVINASPGDLAPVFDAMLDKAMRLCDAAFGILLIAEGDTASAVASRNVPEPFVQFLTKSRSGSIQRLLGSRRCRGARSSMSRTARLGNPIGSARHWRLPVELGGIRPMLMMPMLKDDRSLGLFTIYRQEVRPFSAREIALLENFAAQVVIAMENARLMTETREALEQQTATAEVLRVINSSPGASAGIRRDAR